MSTQNQSAHTVTCEQCGETAQSWEIPHSDYCSDECKAIAEGDRLLNLIRYDHRFCYGCLKQLKEIERPPEELNDFIIGFQYTTEHATHGQKTLSQHRYKDNVGTGTICEGCGTTDHRDDFYESKNVQERAKRLFDILTLTRREGQHNKHVSVERFIEAWNESKHWSYALGKALYE